MKHTATGLLEIFLEGNQRRKVGRLAAQGRRILFEYDQAFLASGLDISPFRLPAKPGTAAGDPAVFDGLFGVFNDSLPDGWGRLLLDRAVEKLGIARGELTPLDRLAHVGRHGMGALSYEPDKSTSDRATTALKLEVLAKDAAVVLAGEEGPVIEKLLKLNGASSGARPKIVAQVSGDKKRIIHGPDALPEGYSHWLIKFPATVDASDIGAVEYAYSLMARDAGVDMPDTHLFGAKKKRYFGIKRFDRDGDRRIHMHSLSGLLNADHRVASLDYDAFLKATHVLTKDVSQLEKAFRIACFNVLAHNRDDHAKNVSFLMDDSGRWVLAPAYDLTFSFGPGGEQTMTVMGEGKEPGVQQLSFCMSKLMRPPSAPLTRQLDAPAGGGGGAVLRPSSPGPPRAARHRRSAYSRQARLRFKLPHAPCAPLARLRSTTRRTTGPCPGPTTHSPWRLLRAHLWVWGIRPQTRCARTGPRGDSG